MKKRTLKILKQFKGSAESRKALEKLKSTDRVMDPLAKIRTEAGFVQLIQDLVKTVLDNEGMQMSPGRTWDALDRVKKSFELKNESLIREYIREVIAESEPATTGTSPATRAISKLTPEPLKREIENQIKSAKEAVKNADKNNVDQNGQNNVDQNGQNNVDQNKQINNAFNKIGNLPASKAAVTKISSQSPAKTSGDVNQASLLFISNKGSLNKKNDPNKKEVPSEKEGSDENKPTTPLKNA